MFLYSYIKSVRKKTKIETHEDLASAECCEMYVEGKGILPLPERKGKVEAEALMTASRGKRTSQP